MRSSAARPAVVLYVARGCHLCERARATLEELGHELEFELSEVDVTGDPALEERYREWLPVVEISGKREFVYFVDPAAFARRLART